jgi:Arc/MetJ-type ribon-helix-helix transcriptional regulator
MFRERYFRKKLFLIITMVRRGKERFEVRLSHATLSKIDEMIETGQYASRSDFINQAIYEKIGEERCMKTIKDILIDLIRTDPEIRDEITKI